MSSVTLNGLGTVELDCNGRALGIGIPSCLEYTELADLPAARREEVARRVRIVRHDTVLPDNRPHTYFRGCIDGHDCTGHTVKELLAAYAEGVESRDFVNDPIDAARRASIILAGDYGYANHIESNDGKVYDVVVDNGKRFRFIRA